MEKPNQIDGQMTTGIDRIGRIFSENDDDAFIIEDVLSVRLSCSNQLFDLTVENIDKRSEVIARMQMSLFVQWQRTVNDSGEFLMRTKNRSTTRIRKNQHRRIVVLCLHSRKTSTRPASMFISDRVGHHSITEQRYGFFDPAGLHHDWTRVLLSMINEQGMPRIAYLMFNKGWAKLFDRRQ